MSHGIARLFEPLQRLLLPAPGRHWSAGQPPAAPCPAALIPSMPRPHPVLRGEDIGLIRPYLVAHEQRQEDKQRRARRRALWFAVHGVDIGPRLIHGVKVATA
ncbi:hypothetical protein ACFRAO_24195 [Streptomyces sp. NPDC056656]|uniref:hypothetical protein n=1 Tax=Streptomyces sp. NPDC056656 TaxID=3345895 RepID=UPI0036851575